MPIVLAALAAALQVAEPAPPPPAETTVEAVEITAAAPIRGDLKEGVMNYPSSFFTPMRPTTALDMVTWLPGFTLEDTRDLRGLEGAIGNVLIDGKPPTSKTDTLASVLRRLPVEQVERVDLIVGGAPGINMRGRNIVANVILKAQGAPPTVVTLHSFLDTRGRASPQLTVTTKRTFGEHAFDGGFELARNIAIFPAYGYGDYVRRDGAGAVLFAADSDIVVGGPTVTGNAAYEAPLAGGRFRISGLTRYYGTDFEERDTLDRPPGLIAVTDDQDYLQGELGLRWERTFGRRALELQSLQRLTRLTDEADIRRPPAPQRTSLKADQRETVLRAVLRWKKAETFTLEGFAEAALNDGETRTELFVNGAPVSLPADDVAIREGRFETGGTLTWKPDPKFSLDLAFKAETSRLNATRDVTAERSFTYGKPRLALAWAPDARTQLRLRLEHEVGQVAFGNFIAFNEYFSGQVRVGNPSIRPQRAWVAEGVVQRTFAAGGDVTLTLRRKALRDVIDVAPVVTDAGVFATTSNIGDAEQTDAVAAFSLPLKIIGWTGAMMKGSVTASEPRIVDPTTGRIRPSSAQPTRQAELHFTQDFPGSRINWGIDAFYRGPSTIYRPFSSDTVGEWLHANIFVERRVGSATSLRLEVQNLPGAHVRQTISIYSGRREQSALLYVDDKDLTNGLLLMARVRRTFN